MPEASDSQAHDRRFGSGGNAQQSRQEASDSIVAVPDPKAANGDDARAREMSAPPSMVA